MRFVTYLQDKSERFGALDSNDRIIDLTDEFGSLHRVLKDGRLDDIKFAAKGIGAIALSDVTLLPPITTAEKYFCIGVNYANRNCLLYTSPSPRDKRQSRMPSSA